MILLNRSFLKGISQELNSFFFASIAIEDPEAQIRGMFVQCEYPPIRRRMAWAFGWAHEFGILGLSFEPKNFAREPGGLVWGPGISAREPWPWGSLGALVPEG